MQYLELRIYTAGSRYSSERIQYAVVTAPNTYNMQSFQLRKYTIRIGTELIRYIFDYR
jgi:hypothetical protein